MALKIDPFVAAMTLLAAVVETGQPIVARFD